MAHLTFDFFHIETSELWGEKDMEEREENRLVEKQRVCGVHVDSQSVGI